jgi:DNA end-binding protein Ku
MRDGKLVGIGRVVLARRERPMVLEPFQKGILATTLHYAAEVRDPAIYFEDISDIKLPAEMKELAEVIIARKTSHFDPSKFEDRYENAVLDLLRTKEAGRAPVAEQAAQRPPNVINIMEALRRSIEAEQKAPARPAVVEEKPRAASKTRGAKAASTVKPRSARKA